MNELAFFVQQIINGLSIGIIYALMAVGLTLIFSIMDVLNFSHGELFMLGAYFCYWSIDLLGLPFMLSLVMGILVVAVISMVLERAHVCTANLGCRCMGHHISVHAQPIQGKCSSLGSPFHSS